MRPFRAQGEERADLKGKRRTSIYLPDDVDRRIRALADRRQLPLSRLITAMIEAGLRRMKA